MVKKVLEGVEIFMSLVFGVTNALKRIVCILCGINNKTVVIRSDGGISSQIAFRALGKEFEKLDLLVKYDLAWFDECGKDCLGKFVRNFDMQKAFPNIPNQCATKKEIFVLKFFYKILSKFIDRTANYTIDLNKEISPVYFGGYPERIIALMNNREWFIDEFLPQDAYSVGVILQEIQNCESCAIHVRRGDLAIYNEYYGFPPNVEFFVEAMRIIKKNVPNIRFFFFSDEMDYVKREIVPYIDEDVDYKLCYGNGSDKGYLDLYLIKSCKHFICSQGSFGAFGRILSKNEGYVIIERDNQYCKVLKKYFSNVTEL